MAKPVKKKKKAIDLMFITSCISTWLVLLLIALVAMLLMSAGRLTRQLKQEMTVELILDDDISDQDIKDLQKTLDRAPYCSQCQFISKSDALDEMTAAMGTDPSMLLKYNPFYASMSVRLQPDFACSDSLEWISEQMEKMKGVCEVTWQKQLLDIVNSNIRRIAIVLLGMALILSLVSFALINNTIKLTIYSQRFLLYSMKLVGAKWSFIRHPFIVRNMWIGLVSALLACATVWFGLKYAIGFEPWLAIMLDYEIIIPVMACIILAGLLITCLCALRSVNRFLRMKSGELYYV